MPDGTWWAEYAWLGGEVNEAAVLLEVKDGRLAAVTPGFPSPPQGCSRLEGLTLPGFANAHSHVFHRVLRGRTHEQRGSFWSWREMMYSVADRLDPDLFRRLARAVFTEMVLAGYTAVGEFHYLHRAPGGVPYSNPNAMGEALIDAAGQVGIRLTLLDTCYLMGGIGRRLTETQERFSDGTAEVWADRVAQLRSTETVRIGAAVHSVRAVPLDEAAVVADFANRQRWVLHAHVSEQREERDQCLAALGTTPLVALHSTGAVDSRFTAVHGTYLTAGEMELLAAAHGSLCACPTTEQDLGDGVGPFQDLRQAGVPLCLGSDSNARVDPLEEARSLEWVSRLSAETRGVFSSDDLLRMATSAGMESLGWERTELKAGGPADFVTIRLDSMRTAGCDPTTPATALFAAAAEDVSSVVIGGDVVVKGGAHVTIAEPAKEIAACVSELLC
jgi:formiminoglutamate deiminase